MAIDLVDYEALDTLLDELDVIAQQDGISLKGKQERRNPRHPFRVGCTVYCYQPNTYTVLKLSGRTRNLSRNGVGLLARRVFAIGEPIEVMIQVPGRPTMYMAGQAVFCRYAGRSYYEIGVALHVASEKPVFSADPTGAYDSLEWLQDALSARSTAGSPPLG